MGFFDDLKKIGEAVGSLNDMAAEVSKTTIEDYGEPEYFLYTALQLGEMHRRIDITDCSSGEKTGQPPREAFCYHGRRDQLHSVQ